MARETIATLPNAVSLSRLGMAAAFPILDDPEARLLLIAAAGATDFLDGYLARTRGESTRLGALIDPIADRCFVLVAVLVLWADDTATPAQLIALSIRDLVVMVAFFATRGVAMFRDFGFTARPAGKVLQLAVLATAYLYPPAFAPGVIAVAAVSLVALGDYGLAFWRGRRAA
jgi:CDP-diacylglycerol--glycerol-3-phosphate 3-phosphatidyltransferase/cardiolipin synthase